MKIIRLIAMMMALATPIWAGTDPLPSWNDGASKTAIVDFVSHSVDPASAGFVPVPDRIAVFDNDGTLWSEQPVYFQFFFALDQARAKAAAGPSCAARKNAQEPSR